MVGSDQRDLSLIRAAVSSHPSRLGLFITPTSREWHFVKYDLKT
jgi:hypothetical protein